MSWPVVDSTGLNEEYPQWFPAEPVTRYVAKLGFGTFIPGSLAEVPYRRSRVGTRVDLAATKSWEVDVA